MAKASEIISLIQIMDITIRLKILNILCKLFQLCFYISNFIKRLYPLRRSIVVCLTPRV